MLAHDARLVLGPWRAALATGRPVVFAAYVVSDDANELLDRQVIAELRVSADAVLHQDGRVDEGVPDSHGQGILELSSEPVPGAPANVLKALYVAGVRTLLLDGGVNLIHEYAAAGLVDRAMAYVPSGSEPLPSSSSPSAGVVPAGFSIERVTKTGRYVRLDAVPRQRIGLQAVRPALANSRG